jgi:hypothetical protein
MALYNILTQESRNTSSTINWRINLTSTYFNNKKSYIFDVVEYTTGDHIFELEDLLAPLSASSDRFVYYSIIGSSFQNDQINLDTLPDPLANFIYSYDFKIFLAIWYLPIYNVSKPRIES